MRVAGRLRFDLSQSDIERWTDDLNSYMEVSKSMKIDDDASLWDTAIKKSVWAKVLAKDAYNLKAIDDVYLSALTEAIQTIDTNLNYVQKLKTMYVPEESEPKLKKVVSEILNLVFWLEIRIANISMNDHVLMLISVVEKKLGEIKEVVEQGEKLRKILEEQDRASKEKMKTYLV